MSTIQEDLEAGRTKLVAAADKLHAVVHGPADGAGSTVETENGPVKSLARALLEIDQSANHVAAETAQAAAEAARDTAQAAANDAGSARDAAQLAEIASDTARTVAEGHANAAEASATTAAASEAQAQSHKNYIVSNYGTITISTGDPSGGADGDTWFKVA
jgi:methyl-accepting chemotaxis protein